MALTMYNALSWDVAPFSLVDIYRRTTQNVSFIIRGRTQQS